MLKLLGLLFLFLGCFFWGWNKSLLLKCRILSLLELQKLLSLLHGEIQCGHTPLPEAFFLAEKKMKPPFDEFAGKLGKSLEEEEKRPFLKIWEDGLSSLKKTGLSGEDLSLIGEVGGRIQAVDVRMQLSVLRLYEELIRERVKKAREEYGTKARMYRYLGALSGLFVVILLF